MSIPMLIRKALLSLWGIRILLLAFCPVLADGPADNQSHQVRPIPPEGTPWNEDQVSQIQKPLQALQARLKQSRRSLKGDSERLRLLCDIDVFVSAVEVALTHQEIYDPEKSMAQAQEQLDVASARLEALLERGPTWLDKAGLVPRGYRSKIDDSIQPYGLVLPDTWQPHSPKPYRLDLWFHGRGEKLTELDFLHQRLHQKGAFTPPDTIVLHLYGRYCNANKFAGEMDLFEALDHVKKDFSIDENRILVRGFSMGGAACWQFATHYAGLWAAAAPGAGFSETKEFLEFFQKEELKPYWWETRLWNLYDATVYAENLYHCPTVAYSGAVDRQKQAADIMARYMEREGLSLTHLVGPDTAHSYHPQTKRELEDRIDALARIGRDPLPRKIRFTTHTLRYHRMHWITLTGLQEHWQKARIVAEMENDSIVRIQTQNVSAFRIDMASGTCPLDPTRAPTLQVDGQTIQAPRPLSDRSWSVQLVQSKDSWALGSLSQPKVLRKRHGLQGPIDDAFMGRFLMVGPSGWPLNPQVGEWVASEMGHALTHWRQQFRGNARFKLDREVDASDIAESNLILWGDPASNSVIRDLMEALPIQWDASGVRLPDQRWDAGHHLPVMIYPNPLNPEKYIVFNSGFTYREYDYLNNARQVPKLPDWAIIDIRQPASPRWPGGIAQAGFFDEKWQWKPQPKIALSEAATAP